MNNRLRDIIGLVITSAVFLLSIFTLYNNHADYFAEVNQAYRSKDAVNLDADLSQPDLAELLLTHDYVTNDTDAQFVARWIVKRRNAGGDFANLGALNLNANRIPADTILAQGGSLMRHRLELSRGKLGVLDDSLTLAQAPAAGAPRIVVHVNRPDSSGVIGKVINRFTHKGGKPVAGVLVRLTEHSLDDATEYDFTVEPKVAHDSVVAWARTDARGVAVLPAQNGHFYSVIPIDEGHEYGREQGTTAGPLDGVAEFKFVQRDHKLAALDAAAYSRIKDDRALTVRTPAQWKDSLVMAAVLFLLAWWLAYLFIARVDRVMHRKSDHLLLIVLMAITALGQLEMFSIADPLVDRLLGHDTMVGIVGGVVAMCAMSCLNVVKFYNGRSRAQMGVLEFDFMGQALAWAVSPLKAKYASLRHAFTALHVKHPVIAFVIYYIGLLLSVILLPVEWIWQGLAWIGSKIGKLIKNRARMPQGIGYLLIAMLLVVLLSVFGTGPEGSGARVNLWFFQPSEVSKFLVVVFIAAFFADNASLIRQFSASLNRDTARFQLRVMFTIVVAIMILLAMYLGLISDMGPGLVLIVTFIFLYSVARGDFGWMLAGVVSFILVLLGARCINNTTTTMLLFAALWLGAWIIGWWLTRRRLYESAVFMNLLIVVFMFGGQALTAMGISEGERLSSRNAVVWSSVWNNEVPGGDQVAQGLWSLATGGLTGQGLGQGNPSMVPAFNTDMAFTSMGEIMGWLSLALVLVALAVLLHRSLLLARRAGHPFVFYLTAGIAIVTGVQFFVIVLGSIGIIPLTGVAVPLLSYGKSSLMINLAAFGLIISCSRERATENQRREIVHYDDVVASAGFTFFCLSAALLGVLFYYQVINRNDILIRPAYVANTQGARIAEYNPRIRLLMNRLDAGNIYDRNGLLLATSDAGTLREHRAELEQNGIAARDINELMHKKLRRYYPFAEHTLFMLGDFNTHLLWGSDDADPYGYMAEKRHLAQLRGFDNIARDDDGAGIRDTVTSKRFRFNRFLPHLSKEYHFMRYDYSALLPMLKSGLKSNAVRHWNEQRPSRDLTLTIDAALQRDLQTRMDAEVHRNAALRNRSKLRASVVVLDAVNGDLLASACYPLPDQERIAEALNSPKYRYNDYGKNFRAYTDRDLGLTYQTQPGSTAKVMSALAGFMKLGDAANAKQYLVYGEERVHANVEPSGMVTMASAIRESSNNYFIHLVNAEDLYGALDTLYRAVGIRVHNARGGVSHTPYYFDIDTAFTYRGEMNTMRRLGMNKYNTYMNRRNQPAERQHWVWYETGNAWGQHNILATPLNMARVAATVANDGTFVPTRYVMAYGTGKKAKRTQPEQGIALAGNTTQLRAHMHAESSKRPSFAGHDMGGKTGTPERAYDKRGHRMNDAWYIFYIYSARTRGYLAVAVRLERSVVGSGAAKAFADDVVIDALNAAGYQLQ